MMWVNKHRAAKKKAAEDKKVFQANGMVLWKRWLGFKAREDMKKMRPRVQQELIDNRKYKNFRNRLIGGQDGGNRFLQGMSIEALKDDGSYEGATVMYDNGDSTYTVLFKSEKRARVNFKHDVQRATGLETMKENKGSLARPKGMNGFPCAAVSGGEIMQRCKMVVLPGSPKKPYATLKVVAGTGIEVADIDLWALDGVQRGTEKSKGGFKSLTRKQKRQLQRFEANCISIVYKGGFESRGKTRQAATAGAQLLHGSFAQEKGKQSLDLIFDYPTRGPDNDPASYGASAKEVMNNLKRLINEIQDEKAYYWDDNGNHCRIRSSLFERYVQSTADLDGVDDDGKSSKKGSEGVSVPKRFRSSGDWIGGRIRNPKVTEEMYFKLKKNQAEYAKVQVETREMRRLAAEKSAAGEDEPAPEKAEDEEPPASAAATEMAVEFPIASGDGGAPGSAVDDGEGEHKFEEPNDELEAERMKEKGFELAAVVGNAEANVGEAEAKMRAGAIRLSRQRQGGIKLWKSQNKPYFSSPSVSAGSRVVIHNPPSGEEDEMKESAPMAVADNTTIAQLKDKLRVWIGWDDIKPVNIYLASAFDSDVLEDFPPRSSDKPRFDVFIKNIYKEATAEEIMKYLKKKKQLPEFEVTDDDQIDEEDDTRSRLYKDPTRRNRLMCTVGYSSLKAAEAAVVQLSNKDLPPPPFNQKMRLSVGLSRYPGPLQEVEELITYQGQTLLYYDEEGTYIGSLMLAHEGMLARLARRERRMLHLSMSEPTTSHTIWTSAGTWHDGYEKFRDWHNNPAYTPPVFKSGPRGGKMHDQLPSKGRTAAFLPQEAKELQTWIDAQRTAYSKGLSSYFHGHPKYAPWKLHWEQLRKLQSLPDGFAFNSGNKVRHQSI